MDVVHLHFDDEATVFRGVRYSDRDGQGCGAGGGKGIEHCLDATDGRTQGEIGHFVFDVQDVEPKIRIVACIDGVVADPPVNKVAIIFGTWCAFFTGKQNGVAFVDLEIAATCVNDVVTFAAQDGIRTFASKDGVIVVASENTVIASTACDRVSTVGAYNGVVTFTTMDFVVARATVNEIVAVTR
jgi:hypothetical protein